MAHYAELDKNNIVIRVIPGIDENVANGELIYQETTGNVWKRTSYNSIGGTHNSNGISFRKNYAGIGYFYDESRDAFIPPKPFESWILNEETCLWEAPIPYPEDSNLYRWSEKKMSWVYV
jgi:hypothetical protein